MMSSFTNQYLIPSEDWFYLDLRSNLNNYDEDGDGDEEALSRKQKEQELQEYTMLGYQMSASSILFKEI